MRFKKLITGLALGSAFIAGATLLPRENVLAAAKQGLTIVVGVALGLSTWGFKKILALRKRTVRPLDLSLPAEKEIHDDVIALATNARLASPEIYVVQPSSPHHVSIEAFSRGLMGTKSIFISPAYWRGFPLSASSAIFFNRNERRAILAHEMAHAINHDNKYIIFITVLISSLTSLVADSLQNYLLQPNWEESTSTRGIGRIIYLSSLFFGAVLFLHQSRSVEYSADTGAVRITNDRAALLSALTKLGEIEGFALSSCSVPGFKYCCQQSIFRTHPLGAARLASIEEIEEMPEMEEEMKGEMKEQSWNYDRVSTSELEMI